MAVVNFDPGYTKTLTILSGQTVSEVIDLKGLGTRYTYSMMFRSPATLPETVTVEVSESPTGTFEPYQSGGADITLAAGEATPITDVIAGGIRLVAGSAVAANRVFAVLANPRR